jgi:hypothetical protein
VTIVIRRSAGATAMLTVAGLLLAGCASGPAQAGSAVIVGDTVITVDQVQQELNDILSQSKVKQDQKNGTLDKDTRGLVTLHVLHELDNRAGKQAGLTVSDQQVDQIISQNGGAGKIADALSVDAGQIKDAVRDILLQAAFTRKYADTLTVTFDYVAADNRNDATAKATKIAADPTQITTMLHSGVQGQAGFAFPLGQYLTGLGQAIQQQGSPPSTSAAVVFGARVGTVLTLQLSAQQGPQWVVALIRDRTVAANPAGATTSSAAGLPPSVLSGIGVNLVRTLVQDVSVKVSPRYGVWDPVGMQVVTDAGQAAGVELMSHPA